MSRIIPSPAATDYVITMAHITPKAQIHLACYALVAAYSLTMITIGPDRDYLTHDPAVSPLNQNESQAADSAAEDIPIEEIDPHASDALELLEKKVEAL